MEYHYDAFISYAAEDASVASRLQAFLQRFKKDGRHLSVYLDKTHIRGGGLTGELGAALASSSALIIVCSRAGASSTWVQREIALFQQREQPRIGLVLAADDPADAIPASLASSEIRFHDVRRGLAIGVWKPAARNELLRLVAWLTGAELSTLINWERRRLLKTSVFALAGLFVPVAGVYRYATRRRPIEASDISLQIVLTWAAEEGTAKGGNAIDNVMTNSYELSVDVLPASSAVSQPVAWTWPTNARSGTGMKGPVVRLTGRQENRRLQSSPSTDGTWFQSIRGFRVEAATLGPLSDIEEWNGAAVAVVYSALGLGASVPVVDDMPEKERTDRLTAEAKAFYGIDDKQFENMDYSIRGVPVLATLTLTIREKRVAEAKARALRVWEHDEDVRDLHVLVFKPFRVRV